MSGSPTRSASVAAPTVVAHHGLLPGYLAGLAWDSMEARGHFQAGVMRLHGVPERRSRSSTQSRRSTASTAARSRSNPGPGRRCGRGRRHGAFTVGERPGHSPSDHVLVIEDGGFALGGDHLIGHISSNPVIHRPLDRPASSRDRMPSLPPTSTRCERTATLDIDLLLPGHGNPVEDHRRSSGAPRLPRAAQGADRRRPRRRPATAASSRSRSGARSRAGVVPDALGGARAPRRARGRGTGRRGRGRRRVRYGPGGVYAGPVS